MKPREITQAARQKYRDWECEVEQNVNGAGLLALPQVQKGHTYFFFSHITVIDLLLQRSYWGLFLEDFRTVPI